MTTPIFLATRLAQAQAVASERQRVESYAGDVLQRSVSTADQADRAVQQLLELVGPGGDHCSDAALGLMQTLDLSSKYIQAVGAMRGNVVTCASLAGRDLDIDLGPPDLVTPAGVRIRNRVTFDFDPDKTVYIVIERDGFGVIVNRDLPIDVTSSGAGVVLASFSYPSGQVNTSRGEVSQAWIQAALDQLPPDRSVASGRATTFEADGYLVSAVTSPDRFVGAVSAIPTSRVAAQAREAAMLLVPIGAAAGVLLAGALMFLARSRLGLPAMIRSGLRHQEFFLLYQPVVDLDTGEWVGAEALLRWKRSNGEIIPPDVFIPVAEDVGLSRQLTEHVFCLAARDLKALAAAHPGFSVALNVSAADLQAAQTVDACLTLLEDSGIDPRALSIEATERGFLDPHVASGVIQQLRALGVRVVIDDFGTGYSSLSYLEALRVDGIKIDKTFVDALGTGAPTSRVVFHIIEMAKALDLHMVAEGVERQAQAAALQEQGVRLAQGWLYSPAIPLKELVAGIARSATAV